jgi:hypothetical protein
MDEPVTIGRNDGVGKVFRFSTVKDAEAAIALLETVIPVSVHAGDYYIDAPEEMVNSGFKSAITAESLSSFPQLSSIVS